MIRNLIILPDGREIFSGADGAAILSVEREENVNPQSFLLPGAVCAAMAQVSILDADDVQITAGDTLRLYRVDDLGERTLAGAFIAQKPERNGKILKITAYDNLLLLDKNLSGWLKGLDGWPYSLLQLADMTCRQCGLEFAPESFLNGELTARPFSFEGVTGRQLLGWIAQAAGCFCRATPEGKVDFGWYTDSGIRLTAGGAPAVGEESGEATSFGYNAGGLSVQEFTTPPIDGICIRQSADDVGTLYPEIAENRLMVTGNPLLAAENAESLLPVAQALLERFQGISYTPCVVTLPENDHIQVGQILRFQSHKIYVMELRRAAGQMVITCRGEEDPQGAAARSQQAYEGLAGKVLKLRTDVDGIFAENSDSKGKLARLTLDVEGIRGQVESTQGSLTRLTTLEQTAEKIALSVEKITNDGASKVKTAAGYTFDETGLQISREGQQMKNLLDNTGMYVTRNEEILLQADHEGVRAVDVKVGNFLVVGDHARFENYGAGRTACFWLEG